MPTSRKRLAEGSKERISDSNEHIMLLQRKEETSADHECNQKCLVVNLYKFYFGLYRCD